MKIKFGVDPDILKLGLVSFLTDISSEMIFSVFAIVFTVIAGASASLLGLVEGLADFSASSLDFAAGWASDRTGKRKAFTILGYSFSTVAKFMLLVANSILALGLFRIIERIGKSFRSPPRDAWISEIATHDVRGLSFGVHKALDKAGAVLGPLIAYALLNWRGETPSAFRLLFLLAILPALLSIFVLSRIKDRPAQPQPHKNLFANWKSLGYGFKRYLVAAAIFSLAYFSFGFLLLRARSIGFAIREVALLYALINITSVIAAPIAGAIGDRIGRTSILALSYLLYFGTCLGFAFATTRTEVLLLFIGYGAFAAIDEAQTKAFIADVEPRQRGTAIGLCNSITGVLYLPASLCAGLLWATHARLVFLLAAALALLALATFLLLRPAHHAASHPTLLP